MGTPILIDLAVGAPQSHAQDEAIALVPLAAAARIAAAAHESGAAAVRLRDSAGTRPVIDPSVAAAYLAGLVGEIGYLVDLPTTGNAPYNVARRILSFDRASAGRAGVVLRPGADDEVSRATAPDSIIGDPARRWSEYAEILVRLWESFPRTALIADQERALVVEQELIRPIDFDGRFYQVAGPLDGPSSVQGRPVLVAADPIELGWAEIARFADVVVVEPEHAATADRDLRAALEGTGRTRTDIVLIGRAVVTVTADTDTAALASDLSAWAESDHLDGLALAPAGDAHAVETAIRTLVPLLSAGGPSNPTGATLRAALGLRETTEVPA
ncbi:LLM class flavin-dependent oxidoreductase [Nocardia jejuensis]|uniref:LLM class flavin-dependent oxidoreductase n=1 Tax=Nocardia jejuensis TaxID=328049 RepID=UPI0008332A36|nr:LLM class flavin-dependent oxidoreductase [Nocardia jejuensis]